jgi:hypothetical protein
MVDSLMTFRFFFSCETFRRVLCVRDRSLFEKTVNRSLGRVFLIIFIISPVEYVVVVVVVVVY